MQSDQGIDPRRLNPGPGTVGLLMTHHPIDDLSLGPTAKRVHGEKLVEPNKLVQVVQQFRPPPTRLGFGQGVIGFFPRLRVQLVQVRPIWNRAVRLATQDNQHGNNGWASPAGKVVDAEGQRRRHKNQFWRQVGNAFPIPLPEQGQPDLSEDSGIRYSAPGEDESAGLGHIYLVGGMSGQFQSEIALNRSAQVAGRLIILAP